MLNFRPALFSVTMHQRPKLHIEDHETFQTGKEMKEKRTKEWKREVKGKKKRKEERTEREKKRKGDKKQEKRRTNGIAKSSRKRWYRE